MAKKDYYEILGVSKNSTDKEIKSAYKKLARKYHPDVNPGNKEMEMKFKEISEAYSVLSNPERRKQYDQFGHQAFQGFDTSSSQWQNINMNDLGFDFGNISFGGGFGDIFSEILGKGNKRKYDFRTRTEGPVKGQDINYTMNLSFMDAIKGISATIALQKNVPCETCSGTGMKSRSPCPSCYGRGSNQTTEKISVKIPEGVDTGSKVRIPGKGEPGRNGGSPGDLYILTNVQPHRYFKRMGDNIYIDVPISLQEAILGTRIDIPTLDGWATVTIKPGTQNGQKLRLKDKGVPHLKGSGSGDLYVVISIVLPQKLDAKSKEIIQEFSIRNPFNPRESLW
ncbi:DnaJ domain-containing protein [bacterium]|nr:DnaJ domain-containing protein [bacterium]